MNRREHGRHSSASHVHGHSGSRLSAQAAAPSASDPALRALANLLVGLTTARDSSGGVWSNTFLAGAVPGAGPGLGSSIPGAVPVPSVSAGASALGGVPPVGGSSITGLSGVGGPSLELPRSKRSHEHSPARRESRSGKAGARRCSPSLTRPSRAVPSPAPASPASLGAVEAGEVRSSPSRGPCSAVGGLSSEDRQGFSDVCVPWPLPSGFSVQPHSSEMPGLSRSRLAGRSSPAPSGAGEDDQPGSVGSLDPERGDSFASVLSLIQEFHGIEEPAGVAPNRCKTSLAPVYGLQSESSLALHLPTSPLVEALIEDVNSALAKFVEDQTVHGFIPIPSRRHQRYYRTSSSSFPGPYSVPPGLAAITLDRVSETKKRSFFVSLSSFCFGN